MVNRRWNKDLSFCFVHFIFLVVVNRRWNKDLSFCFVHFIFLVVVNRRWNKDLSLCGFWFRYSYCDLYCEWSLEQVRWSRKKSKMVMVALYVVIVMFVSHINVCMYRLMFAKKEGFGKGVMWCNIDGQESEVGCMKNVICRVYKCCCSLFSFIVWLFTTFLSNLKVSCRISTRHNLLRRGARFSSSSFRWSRGRQHATKCMYIPNVLTKASISTRLVERGGGDGEDARDPCHL